MSWILLVGAGLFEVVWASLLPATAGLSRPVPTVAFLAALAVSMYGLAKATETIPIGTGYVVWVGIGAVGAAVVGMTRGDPVSALRIACLAAIVAGVVGLKLSSGH